MYGRYPDAERWRVDLAYVLALAGLVPLMIPRVPGKLWNAVYVFAIFPVLAFFLLVGRRARACRMSTRRCGAACW